MNDTFLTAEELHRLTGYRHAGKQITVLTRNNIPFTLNGRGKPVVSREAYLYGKKRPKPPSPTWQPNIT